MATMMRHRLALTCLALLLGLGARAQAADIASELPDPAAVRAYKNYWSNFDAYEKKLLERGKDKYQKAWNELQADSERLEAQATAEQIRHLKAAADRYRDHLSEHSSADNAPYVILNLAQILNKIGDHYGETDQDAGASYKQEALGLLTSLDERFPDFERREDALYLRALILASLKQDVQALAAWQKLADSARTTLYGVQANVAVGDHYFEIESAPLALKYYRQALSLVDRVAAEDQDYERLRIQYRIAWAAYRAADLKTSIETGIELLAPGRNGHKLNRQKKIEADAIELIGDSLFENNNFAYIRATLKRRALLQAAPRIALRILQRYNVNKLHDNLIELAELVVEDFPTAREQPEWLAMMATSLEATNQERKRIQALERLALLLPKQSLWRARHRDDFEAIKTMEDRASSGAKLAAAYHYEHGMASGNAASFRAAASFYAILIEFDPAAADANRWRMKQANCAYFAGDLDKADEFYSSLKATQKLDPETLEAASYQLVLTRDKQWREAFGEAGAKGVGPQRDPITIERLRKLEASIEEYANRFPHTNRTVDLLLVGAAANRDHENYEEASRFWQRALVSNPTPSQRAIAIRGLVMAKVNRETPQDVIDLTKKLLRLEDWSALGLTLGEELKGVLSAAALDQSDRLNKSGEVGKAGMLLVSIAREFENLPDRDRIYRDGAYMLAISGDWNGANQAAGAYLDDGFRTHADDMLYLKARSEEYQIRFAQASESYLELGKRYPGHSRAMASLERAEGLALAENNTKLAAEAAMLIGDRSKVQKTKIEAYQRAYGHYAASGDYGKALVPASAARKAARTLDERLSSELLMAKANYEIGREDEALKAFARVGQAADRGKASLGEDAYGRLAGESYYALGEEARRQFEDFEILGRSGTIKANVNTKARYFETMVKHYEKAIKAKHPEWAPQSRFRIAEAAEQLSDEVGSIPLKSERSLADAERRDLQSTAGRLKKLAQQYLSANLLARSQEPAVYKNNVWIKKSSLKLSGYSKATPSPDHEEQLPSAISLGMPYQWSL